MPHACFVSGCKSHNKCSRFKFPKDQALLNKWVEAIGKSLENRKIDSARVCELHFNEEDIQRELIVEAESGQVLTCPFKVPRLVKGAIPSIFKTNPLYYAKIKKFETIEGKPNHTKEEIIFIDVQGDFDEEHEATAPPLPKEKVTDPNQVGSFKELITRSSHIVHGEDWIVSRDDGHLHYFYVGRTLPVPKLSVHISGSLNVKIAFENFEIKALNNLDSVVPVRVTNVKQIESILKICGDYIHKKCKKTDNNTIINELIALFGLNRK